MGAPQSGSEPSTRGHGAAATCTPVLTAPCPGGTSAPGVTCTLWFVSCRSDKKSPPSWERPARVESTCPGGGSTGVQSENLPGQDTQGRGDRARRPLVLGPWQRGGASPLGQYRPYNCPSESALSPASSGPLVTMTTTAATQEPGLFAKRLPGGLALLLRRCHLLSSSHLGEGAGQSGRGGPRAAGASDTAARRLYNRLSSIPCTRRSGFNSPSMHVPGVRAQCPTGGVLGAADP